MNPLARLFGSTIGKKVLMAVSGLALFGFLMAHLAGNLLVFAGPEAINAYSHALLSRPGLLWAARSGLLMFSSGPYRHHRPTGPAQQGRPGPEL